MKAPLKGSGRAKAGGVTVRRTTAAVVLLAALVLGMGIATAVDDDKQAEPVAPVVGLSGPAVGQVRTGESPSGPLRVVDGVGMGFTHDEAGAVAAATNLVLTLEQAAHVDRTTAIEAYEALAAEASRDPLGADMAAVWDALHAGLETNGPPGGRLFVRAVPVGQAVTRYSPERATVEVWTLSLLVADGGLRPVATWETASVELVWEAGDWKVWSVTSRAGPTPAWGADPVTDVVEFLVEMSELEGYRYVAD